MEHRYKYLPLLKVHAKKNRKCFFLDVCEFLIFKRASRVLKRDQCKSNCLGTFVLISFIHCTLSYDMVVENMKILTKWWLWKIHTLFVLSRLLYTYQGYSSQTHCFPGNIYRIPFQTCD